MGSLTRTIRCAGLSKIYVPWLPILRLVSLALQIAHTGFDDVFPLWALSTVGSGGLDWTSKEIGQVCVSPGHECVWLEQFRISPLRARHYTPHTDHCVILSSKSSLRITGAFESPFPLCRFRTIWGVAWLRRFAKSQPITEPLRTRTFFVRCSAHLRFCAGPSYVRDRVTGVRGIRRALHHQAPWSSELVSRGCVDLSVGVPGVPFPLPSARHRRPPVPGCSYSLLCRLRLLRCGKCLGPRVRCVRYRFFSVWSRTRLDPDVNRFGGSPPYCAMLYYNVLLLFTKRNWI